MCQLVWPPTKPALRVLRSVRGGARARRSVLRTRLVRANVWGTGAAAAAAAPAAGAGQAQRRAASSRATHAAQCNATQPQTWQLARKAIRLCRFGAAGSGAPSSASLQGAQRGAKDAAIGRDEASQARTQHQHGFDAALVPSLRLARGPLTRCPFPTSAPPFNPPVCDPVTDPGARGIQRNEACRQGTEAAASA